MRIRGHVLVWPGWNNLPQSLQRLRGTPDAATLIPQRVLEHIDDVTTRTAPYMDEWDVINEPYTNHDLMDLYGNGMMVDWFVRAREHLPHAGLVLNDYDILSRQGAQRAHQDHFEATARFLIESGAPITGLGLQGHFGASPTSMATIKRLLDRYAALGLSLRITEFDINTADEALQADYTRDFLTMVFSHPAVTGFQMWGFWEGAHWLPRGAMYRRDWSEKPNGETFRRLVHEVWRSAAAGRTDDDGRFATRAFYGQYEVTVTWRGQTRVIAVDHVKGDRPTVVRVEVWILTRGLYDSGHAAARPLARHARGRRAGHASSPLRGIALRPGRVARRRPPSQIRIRDPFVLPDPAAKVYYIYGSTNRGLSPSDARKEVVVYQDARPRGLGRADHRVGGPRRAIGGARRSGPRRCTATRASTTCSSR